MKEDAQKGSILSQLLDITQVKWFSRWLMIGFLCQSVLIGGGYATGRELVEFFMMQGLLQGLYGMAVSTFCFALVGILIFDYARKFHLYNYRSFFQSLLPGSSWLIFEVGYIFLVVLVGGILSSAAGTILQQWFGISYWVGVTILLVGTSVLLFAGGKAISTILSYWSFYLYAIMFIFLVVAIRHFGMDGIFGNMLRNHGIPGNTNWVMGGIKYTLYNMVSFLLVLYALKDTIKTRRDAVINGIVSSIVMMIPAVIEYLAMVPAYPSILQDPVPVFSILKNDLGGGVLLSAYVLMLFGTSIETITGFVHGLNERINSVYQEKGREMSPRMRGLVGLVIVVICFISAKVGLVALIARGYSLMAWYFLFIMVLPLTTVGFMRLRGKEITSVSVPQNLEEVKVHVEP
ncbi:YkvI family membrane protein [Aminobacterium mobile]|uniref:YkvI family membrane protein n=1 Tax=Aminobacterium mobile TaxID=81467 RepID=UPI003314523F